jgi:glycosyltransferase involved in cell wall biosynthesis
MKDAAVYVVPLRIGGGTRLKIFEAMAMGRAVVSTAVGAEGLPVEHGRHLLLADDPQRFAQATVDLLRNLPQRQRLETAARELVVEHYDWSAVACGLDDALTATRRKRLEPAVSRGSTLRAQPAGITTSSADL